MRGSDVIGPNEPPLTRTRGSSADSDHRAAEQQTQSDGAACAEPGSHIILSTAGGRSGGAGGAEEGGAEAGATGGEPGETGRCASATARTVAGSAGASRGAYFFFVSLTQSPSNPGEAFTSSPRGFKSAYERAPPRNHEKEVKQLVELCGGGRLRRKFRHRLPPGRRCVTARSPTADRGSQLTGESHPGTERSSARAHAHVRIHTGTRAPPHAHTRGEHTKDTRVSTPRRCAPRR